MFKNFYEDDLNHDFDIIIFCNEKDIKYLEVENLPILKNEEIEKFIANYVIKLLNICVSTLETIMNPNKEIPIDGTPISVTVPLSQSKNPFRLGGGAPEPEEIDPQEPQQEAPEEPQEDPEEPQEPQQEEPQEEAPEEPQQEAPEEPQEEI